MKILVHDFAGHPFQVQLSRELAKRGHRVVHAHCPAYASGKGGLARRSSDPTHLGIVAVGLSRYDKHSIRRRAWQELTYGRRLARLVKSVAPDLVISANTPLLAQALVQARCRRAGVAFVFWQQDILSFAIARLAGERLGNRLAGLFARPFLLLERRVARRSDAVVVISPAFLSTLSEWGVPDHQVTLIENWAPLDDLPRVPRDNAWASEHDLLASSVVLYSGTLGLKHGSQKLGQLARELGDAAVVVVVSGGPAADDLAAWARQNGVVNLVVLPFQPYQRLAEVLGTADVLLAILDERAGELSVPSKVLSYLSAGRPVVASMPYGNLAARTIEAASAGTIVRPGDVGALASAVRELVSDGARRDRLGRNARDYAETHFDVAPIAGRFENVFEEAAAARSRQTRRSRPPIAVLSKEGRSR